MLNRKAINWCFSILYFSFLFPFFNFLLHILNIVFDVLRNSRCQIKDSSCDLDVSDAPKYQFVSDKSCYAQNIIRQVETKKTANQKNDKHDGGGPLATPLLLAMTKLWETTVSYNITLSEPALATGGVFFSGWITTVTFDELVCPPVSVTFNMKV